MKRGAKWDRENETKARRMSKRMNGLKPWALRAQSCWGLRRTMESTPSQRQRSWTSSTCLEHRLPHEVKVTPGDVALILPGHPELLRKPDQKKQQNWVPVVGTAGR